MALKKITEITRKGITKLFKKGYTDNTNFLWDSKYSSPNDGKIFMYIMVTLQNWIF